MHAEQITPITPITPITSIGQRPLVKVLTALAAWIAAVLLVAATFAAGPGQVQDSTEATPADAAITQRVENALAKDPFLRRPQRRDAAVAAIRVVDRFAVPACGAMDLLGQGCRFVHGV